MRCLRVIEMVRREMLMFEDSEDTGEVCSSYDDGGASIKVYVRGLGICKICRVAVQLAYVLEACGRHAAWGGDDRMW